VPCPVQQQDRAIRSGERSAHKTQSPLGTSAEVMSQSIDPTH